MILSHHDVIQQLKAIRSSDVISIHIDYNKKNHNFFDQKYLSLMKKSSFLVNTSELKL